MTLKAADIAALVELFSASEWSELHVEMDGVQIFLSTDPNARLTNALQSPPTLIAAPVLRSPPADAPARLSAQQAPRAVAAEDGPVPQSWTPVKAPNLGTFYRAPKPGAQPFVEIGQGVDVDTEICLLEVMKLFTAVKAGIKGVVRRICVNDAELVEAEQILFYVERV